MEEIRELVPTCIQFLLAVGGGKLRLRGAGGGGPIRYLGLGVSIDESEGCHASGHAHSSQTHHLGRLAQSTSHPTYFIFMKIDKIS
jgi:hypothetical protein